MSNKTFNYTIKTVDVKDLKLEKQPNVDETLATIYFGSDIVQGVEDTPVNAKLAKRNALQLGQELNEVTQNLGLDEAPYTEISENASVLGSELQMEGWSISKWTWEGEGHDTMDLLQANFKQEHIPDGFASAIVLPPEQPISFSKETAALMYITKYSLPNAITIGSNNFHGAYLVEYEFPNTLVSIGEFCFTGAAAMYTALGSPVNTYLPLTLPDSVKSIGMGSFQNFVTSKLVFPKDVEILSTIGSALNFIVPSNEPDNYAEIVLPTALKELETSFIEAQLKGNIYLPATLEKYGMSNFSGATIQGALIFEGLTPPQFTNDGEGNHPETAIESLFYNNADTLTVYVPDAAYDTYLALEGWSTYSDKIKRISELPII